MTDTPNQFEGRIALGHFLRLYTRDKRGEFVAVKYAFQNFYFGENRKLDGVDHVFIPFGFSGIGTNKNGDVEPATLVFPNDAPGLSRSFISEALRGEDIDVDDPERIVYPYVAVVDVMMLDDGAKDNKLYTYTGVCSSASWDDTEAMLELAHPLNAVSGDIPTRTLRKDLVGNLPTSSAIRIR